MCDVTARELSILNPKQSQLRVSAGLELRWELFRLYFSIRKCLLAEVQ